MKQIIKKVPQKYKKFEDLIKSNNLPTETMDRWLDIFKKPGSICLATRLLLEVAETLRKDGPEKLLDGNTTLAMLSALDPQNESEAILISQMASVHSLAMRFLALATHPNQTSPGVTENVERANKLIRTYVALDEALHRHRGKGNQKVVVEHVHVYPGGQAIVGTVDHKLGPMGAGGVDEN